MARACSCVRLSRSAYYRAPDDWTVRDAPIIACLAKLIEDRPSRGFWMCRKLLRREGHDSVWSADFMSDALICGRRYRLFNVVDDFNREALHIEVDTSINSERLIRVFDRLRKQRGLPQILRTDNGPEFLGEAFTQWAKSAGMAIQYIQPGKPNQNAYIERFNRTLRNELLDQHLFVRLEDVREAAYWWLLEYNEERPHDALGDLTPIEYAEVARNSSSELSP